MRNINMNFRKFLENYDYHVIANYIIENNIKFEDFVCEIFNENTGSVRPFFGIPTFQKPSRFKFKNFIDGIKSNITNKWNNFRGVPNNIQSIIGNLEKISNFLSSDVNMQNLYRSEIASISNIIQGIKDKNKTEKQKTFDF